MNSWSGAAGVTVFDKAETFLEDSSGLDFYKGQLYAVDNGRGAFWILDVAKDGTLRFAPGFESGKKSAFKRMWQTLPLPDLIPRESQ